MTNRSTSGIHSRESTPPLFSPGALLSLGALIPFRALLSLGVLFSLGGRSFSSDIKPRPQPGFTPEVGAEGTLSPAPLATAAPRVVPASIFTTTSSIQCRRAVNFAPRHESPVTNHESRLPRGGANFRSRLFLDVHTPLYAEVPRIQEHAYERHENHCAWHKESDPRNQSRPPNLEACGQSAHRRTAVHLPAEARIRRAGLAAIAGLPQRDARRVGDGAVAASPH